jgi:hypothetical protein
MHNMLYLHSAVKELAFLDILDGLVFEGAIHGVVYLLPLSFTSE